MKTTSFRFILAALAATTALVGCTKEITPNFENDKVNPEGARVIAVSFASQTKTTLIEDGFQPVFVNGDKILVANGIDEPDTCVVSVKDKKATISTNLTGPLNAVYPAKAARMDEQNPKAIGGVLVFTEQDGTFANANICMVKNIPENATTATFENKTAVFRIIPHTGKSAQYVEVRADGYDIANYFTDESAYKDDQLIHVEPITADTVYVSILVPEGLKVGDLTFSDGTNEKTVTGEKASTEIERGTLYTVTNENWESPAADTPEPLKGVFSVGTDKQVQFSLGNLRYIVGTKEWGFYEHQYDFCNTTIYQGHHSDTVSLFTWGYNENKSTEPDGDDSDNISRYIGNLAQTEDWGFVFGGESSIWRTLTRNEWCYLFAYNPDDWDYDSTSPRYNLFKAGVTVCGIENCVVLLPDDWAWDASTVGTNWQTDYPVTAEDKVTWQTMEDAGAVCLPAAGYRYMTNINDVVSYGHYWSATPSDENEAYIVEFASDLNAQDTEFRYYGCSVRLVTDVSAAPTPTEPDYVVMKANVEGTKTLKWATKNLGAEKVATDYRCYGDYYQWGSVDKLYSSIDWTDNTTGSFVGLKEGGFAETNLTYKENADLSDATNDVVKKTYPGTNWRMPTKQEFQDLYDACVGADGYDTETKPTGTPIEKGVYWCDSYDGVAGVLFYDGTNVLFFPAAGGVYGTGLGDAGGSGYYWSSSLFTDDTGNAYYVDFYSNKVYPQSNKLRFLGFPVRPVSD